MGYGKKIQDMTGDEYIAMMKDANPGRSMTGNDAYKNAGNFDTAFTKLSQGMEGLFGDVGKLAGGTYNAKDAVNSFNNVMNVLGANSVPILKEAIGASTSFAEGVVGVNQVLNETQKYGVSFNQNLGEANLAIKGAQLTIPEFGDLIRSSGKDMAGFAGGQNESAKRFLAIMKDLQSPSNEFGYQMKLLGVQTPEFADALAASTSATFFNSMTEKEAHDRMMKATSEYIRETTLIADLTGKSRKEQEDARKKVMESAEIEAAIMRRNKIDPEFGTRMNEATLSMGRFGPGMQKLLAEEATMGGARSEEALKMKATLGPAAEAVAAYGKALQGGNAQEIERTKAAAIAATENRVRSDEFLKTTEILGDSVYSYGELLKNSYNYEKNIAGIKEEMHKKGFALDREVSTAEAEDYARQRDAAKRNGEILTTYDEVKKKWNTEKEKGTEVGKGLNAFDDMAKKVGTKTAEEFDKLNTQVGTAIRDKFPEFNKQMGAIASDIQSYRAGRGAENLKAIREGKSPKSSFADGTKDVLGDWFGGNFGSGTPSMLHGIEAVIPKDKIGEFVKDMSSQGGQMAEQVKTGMGPMLEGLMGNIKTQVSSINTADIQGKIQSMTGNLTNAMNNAQSGMPDLSKVFGGATGSSGVATNEIKDQLVLLNKGMAQLISHAAETAQATEKQVRAIKSASNNKFD